MLEFVCYFMPSFISITIHKNIMKEENTVNLLLYYGIYVALNNLLSLTVVMIRHMSEYVFFDNINVTYCFKYLLTSIVFSIVIPFIIISWTRNSTKNTIANLINKSKYVPTRALTQFEKAFNDEEEKNKENINKNLCLNYYLLGVQQEYLKRKNDSINSFASAKLYMPQSGKNRNNIEFNFIKKIHIPKSDANTCPINFRESLSSGS